MEPLPEGPGSGVTFPVPGTPSHDYRGFRRVLSQVLEEPADMWWNPAHPRTFWWGRRDWYRSDLDLVLLGWWSLPVSQKRWDHIRYQVDGSLVVYHWRERGRIQIFWAVTSGPQYPSYKTSTVMGQIMMCTPWLSNYYLCDFCRNYR
jgi:hypothetical protein